MASRPRLSASTARSWAWRPSTLASSAIGKNTAAVTTALGSAGNSPAPAPRCTSRYTMVLASVVSTARTSPQPAEMTRTPSMNSTPKVLCGAKPPSRRTAPVSAAISTAATTTPSHSGGVVGCSGRSSGTCQLRVDAASCGGASFCGGVMACSPRSRKLSGCAIRDSYPAALPANRDHDPAAVGLVAQQPGVAHVQDLGQLIGNRGEHFRRARSACDHDSNPPQGGLLLGEHTRSVAACLHGGTLGLPHRVVPAAECGHV